MHALGVVNWKPEADDGGWDMTRGCAADLTNGRGGTSGETCQMKSINRIAAAVRSFFRCRATSRQRPRGFPVETNVWTYYFFSFFFLLLLSRASGPDVIIESDPKETRNSPGFDILLKNNNITCPLCPPPFPAQYHKGYYNLCHINPSRVRGVL